MTIVLPARVESELIARAKGRGITPEALASEVIQQQMEPQLPLVPRDDWERRVLAIGVDPGAPVTDRDARDRALSSEGLYD